MSDLVQVYSVHFACGVEMYISLLCSTSLFILFWGRQLPLIVDLVASINSFIICVCGVHACVCVHVYVWMCMCACVCVNVCELGSNKAIWRTLDLPNPLKCYTPVPLYTPWNYAWVHIYMNDSVQGGGGEVEVEEEEEEENSLLHQLRQRSSEQT